MRLLLVSTWLPYPADNGSRVRAWHLLRHLAWRHQITLLAFGRSGTHDLAPLRAVCEHVELLEPPMNGHRPLDLRGLMSRTPRHFAQTDSPAMKTLIRQHLPGHDVAIGLQVDAARYLEPLAGMPRVFDEVEVTGYRDRYLHERSLPVRARRGLTWWKFQHFTRRLVGVFERTTVVSVPEWKQLRDIGCDVSRVAIVPNGTDISSAEPSARRAARVIYPGSVAYSANLDAVRWFAGEVWPLVRQSQPDLEFWVTGSTDGVDVSPLQRAGVIFTGALPSVDDVIAESAACVVPLRIGGGTRLKALQAMALGTPVVSTSKGIEGLDVTPGRDVLVGDTPNELADLVLRVCRDWEHARSLAASARQLVAERYDWSRIGESFESVVHAAVSDHRARVAH